MDGKPNAPKGTGMNRRNFIGALGGAATAAALLQHRPASALPAQVYYYQDSFGNVAPAGQGAIDLGVYPPAVPTTLLPPGGANPGAAGEAGATYYSSGYPKYNILLIMVDQMRNPAFWLPSSGAPPSQPWYDALNSTIPNICQLAKWSFSFPNYWVAATICGPSRACLLTGLYTQQTCIFRSGGGNNAHFGPPLLPYNPGWSTSNNVNPGFPTIGNVLSQNFGSGGSNSAYDCTWIGKWHLSCISGTQDGSPGAAGPSDYGFLDPYSLPNVPFVGNPYPANNHGYGYPSPNGYDNEGTGGDFLDSLPQSSSRDVPNFYGNTGPFFNNAQPGYAQLNDAAIAGAFTNYWLPYASSALNYGANNAQPHWFCAVSFVNPHDISDFPYPFGLTTPTNNNFTAPTNGMQYVYQPPPSNTTSNTTYYGNNCSGGANATQCTTDGDLVKIPAYNNSSLYTDLPYGTGNNGYWNWEDLTSSQLQYTNNGKPGLQLYFKKQRDAVSGGIASPGTYNNSGNNWSSPYAWQTFLNYYLWMQACVDHQVGEVLGTNADDEGKGTGLRWQDGGTFWNNTVIIFTSDHGDYAGSHGLHAKGGALYEESMNVPLFISYPEPRYNNQTAPVILPYVCSSVDLLPFLYSLALGNASWRTNNNDMIYYLRYREAIEDSIYYYSTNNSQYIQQRRISSIPLYNPPGTCSANSSGCAWKLYQPFVLHTADDFAIAPLGNNSTNNCQPSHAVAFRTVDQTDVNNNPASLYPGNSYGGGKLGVYSFWDTCDATAAPIMGINNATLNAANQYEFYNYSQHPPGNATQPLSPNPQEVGNQYFDANNGGNPTVEATLYLNDFFNNNQNNNQSCNSTEGCETIQSELYYLPSGNNTQQVQAAIQAAFANYLLFLECTNQMTGSDGRQDSCKGNSCPSY